MLLKRSLEVQRADVESKRYEFPVFLASCFIQFASFSFYSKATLIYEGN